MLLNFFNLVKHYFRRTKYEPHCAVVVELPKEDIMETIVAHGYHIVITKTRDNPAVWSAEIIFASDGRKMHAVAMGQSSCRMQACALAAQNVTQDDLNAQLPGIPSNRTASVFPGFGPNI